MTAVRQRGRQQRNPTRWWTPWSSQSSETGHGATENDNEEGGDPIVTPSTSVAGSGGTAAPLGGWHSAGRRVRHRTSVPIGDRHSPHYLSINQYYGFPKLGEVSMG